MDQIEKVVDLFRPYSFIITQNKEIKAGLDLEMTKLEYQAQIDKYNNFIKEVDEKIPNEIHMSMGLLDCRQIKREITEKCQKFVAKILENIMRNTNQQKTRINEDVTQIFSALTKPITNAYELEEAQNKIESIEKEEKKNIEDRFALVFDWIQMMYNNRARIEEHFLKSTWGTAEKVQQIYHKVQEARDKIDNEKVIIEEKLRESKADFMHQLAELDELITNIKEEGQLHRLEDTYNKVMTVTANIKEYTMISQEINVIEEKLGYRTTKFDILEDAIKIIVPFKDLWTLAYEWENKYSKTWLNNSIFELDTEDIIKKSKIMTGSLAGISVNFESMEAKPTNAIKQVQSMTKKIDEFRKLEKLLVSLSARGMQERHWKEINLICKNQSIEMSWSKTSSYCLSEAAQNGMIEIAEELTEISVRANREFSNQNLLDEMENEWKNIEIGLKEWADTKTFVIHGESVDELTTILDDHIIKTQTMKGSSSAKVFEARINNWERDLLYIRHTLEDWVLVQSSWLYLQPIFLSPDIKRELKEESEKFTRVDKRWRELMAHILKHPMAIELPKNETLHSNLLDMLKQLEEVQDKLTDYLNKKRSEFPRFYFLSAPSLIEVLSDARDPTKIQKFAKILFEGVKNFNFDKDERILGVTSSEGEKLEFTEAIETMHHQGLVEKWLRIFEDTLANEVRRQIEISFEDLEVMEREKFILDRPGQAVLNVNMTKWTSDTEEAIKKGGSKGLANLLSLLNNNLENIVELVKKSLTHLNRCTLEALIVLDVHNRVVINSLIEANVQSITDFDYEAQLRYYWEQKEHSTNPQKETIVKIINSVMDYSYEYLGNSERLVITPLTDRCYRTLCGAVGLFYGGAPEGPAGTGKTETVKDLAKALARMIVVFNCSDNLDYLAMARFFKGLASTGGWSCFDEFNRIHLEVLSVIAQQLQSIQNAVKEGKSEFFFVDTRIKLKLTCNCFITMNPGYAGRSELPDNLKALFRTVAMMVPDYALIAEIRLYSYGFSKASDLARKIVTTYKLCSEQISAQKHYDYGMRAVQSVLKAAGNLRKADSKEDEDVQVLRAINEVNEAKFLSIDLPLFKAITGDLFPETKLEEKDFKKLFECVDIVMKRRKLQPHPYFMEKIVQLYQMILVRHGLMVVGSPYCGKSSWVLVLSEALAEMQEKGYGERKVEFERLNPKSVTNHQLYGITDIATGEWFDGVLPVKFKKLAISESPDRKWMWFDGPVDAIWIEDMNTVLDDNKKLCLANGDIYYMSSTMNLIFEPEDLLVASPATVSRCGMIYGEPHMMGWMHLYNSWKLRLPEHFEEYVKDDMDVYFVNVLTPLLDLFDKGGFDYTAPAMVQNIVVTLLKIADQYLAKFSPAVYDAVEFKERKALFDMIFVYATVWSAGAVVTNTSRQKFDTSIRRFVNSPELTVPEEFKKLHRRIKLPDSGRVFDFLLEFVNRPVPNDKPEIKFNWKHWGDLLTQNSDEIPKSTLPTEIIVETMDSVRYSHIIKNHMDFNNHSLICGPTGTGKTIYIKSILRKLDKSKFSPLEIGFSAQTTAGQVQNIIDAVLTRRKKGFYGPVPGKKMIIFVDDLNMPKKEEFGAQPPIELLRQMLDQGGWYDNVEKIKPFKQLEDIVFMSAMGPPGRNTITARFQRHLNFISFTELDEAQMHRIFQVILEWRFKTGDFTEEVKKMSKFIIKATSQIYINVCENFLPLPIKSHYLFNLRDFSKVIMGICMARKDAVESKQMCIKLWVHEIWRVFCDRLNCEEDRLKLLLQYLKPVTSKVFGENFDALFQEFDKDDDGKIETLLEMRGLVFTDVIYPGTMPERPYEFVNNQQKLYDACNGALKQYDLMSDKPLNIVLFNFAIEHLLIISRILKQPGGNGLLVGVGGSGRQSLTKLAAQLAANNLYQIELTKKYDVTEWKDDLKNVMKSAGRGNKTVFLFCDNQIKKDSFIEDVNNLLNNGEVPNLFPPEELGEVLEIARNVAADQEREIETTEDLLAFFTETIKRNLHVILCFSPIGDGFRNRIRNFPALVNCCTIDWFFEWPEEALKSVASQFLNELPIDKQIIEKCVETVQFFHRDTARWSKIFEQKLRRHNYVTPTSYIEMINQFKILLGEKSKEVRDLMNKYKNGYTMIIEAEKSVGILQENLTLLVPELEKAAQETAIILEKTNKAKEEAEIVKSRVSVEEEVASRKAEAAKKISDECQSDMDAVKPKIEEAKSGLDKIDPKDFEFLKGAQKLSVAPTLVFEALCYVMNPEPITKRNPETLKNEIQWWDTAKRMLQDHRKLILRMQTFNDNNNIVSEQIYKKLKKFLEDPENVKLLDKQAIVKGAGAAWPIFQWVQGQAILYPVEMDIRPKRAALALATAEKEEAMGQLAIKQAELQEIIDQVDALVSKLNQAQAKKEKLETQYATCKVQLGRAEMLIANLGDEKGRWLELSEQLSTVLYNITGDVLVSAGLMSYLGPFTSLYRSEIISTWAQFSQDQKIPGSVHFDFVKTMGNPIQIRAWQINGLPSDSFSTENAIIQNKAGRWALCIDPQLQANKWIKNTYKSLRLVTTKLENEKFMNDVERSIRQGLPCLMENVGTSIDSSLNPILLKQITRSGGTPMIKLGDKLVDYDEGFLFMLTTKLRNPHYLPEVSTKVTIINFMITTEGLTDQLLATIVSKEKPEHEREKNRLIEEGAKNKKELQELEDAILETLSQDIQKLVEDDVAIDVLTKSKKKSIQINEEQKIAAKTEEEIDKARKNYLPVSQEASCLFFAIQDLGFIDPMYQYSLTYFVDLFIFSIEKSMHSEELHTRLSNISEHFLFSLYKNVSRSLFVKDKLLFSFLLSVRIKQFNDQITQEQYDFILTGAVGTVANKIAQPAGFSWISEQQWLDICRLSEIGPKFKDLHKNFKNYAADWERIYKSPEPQNEPLPEIYEKSLDSFEAMMLLKCIRPEKLIPMIQKFVIENMGREFVEPPAFQLDEIYKDSNNCTPLIFVLTPGVDPFNNLSGFAEVRGITLQPISLGQGQGDAALKLIDEGMKSGFWVILQNCHLAVSFMPALELKCEQILSSSATINADFRLWLTSYPSEAFPVSVLQNGLKMTNEPPSGLKNNLRTAFSLETIANEQTFNSGHNPRAYRRLVFSLCFFHSVIQERRKYGPLGWNIPYEFTESDLRISSQQLQIFINKYPDEVPLDALRYLTAECNYGGRVTDDKDRRLIITLLKDYYNEDAFTIEHYSLAPGFEDFYIPSGASYHDYMNYIEEMSLDSNPGVYGFHSNASITKEINETNKLLETLISCQGLGGGASGDESSRVVKFIDDILSDFPEPFNIKEIRKKYKPKREEGMNTVLVQEIARYNKLIALVRESLSSIKDALNGLIVFSVDLEQALANISIGRVPSLWMKISYPSLKTLAGYIKDLIKRVNFFNDWLQMGKPVVYWLPGFYFPQGFLTGVLQNYARKYTIAIDELEHDVDVIGEGDQITEQPEDGAYIQGIFLEGARFNHDTMLLDESEPKILYTKAPVFYLRPSTSDAMSSLPHYKCPLYRTSERRGVLATTGHSTNFVMNLKIPTDCDQSHWIKRGVAALCALDD